MSKVITIVGNYFGTPPHSFQLWLDGCRANAAFRWIVLTDILATGYDLPKNVNLVPTTQGEFRALLQRCFDYPIRYNCAWDACAFKPCSGVVYADYLKDSDFWGWCDFDVIYGDLSPLAAAAETYDKIMPEGHLALVRNDPKLNEFICCHPLTRQALAEDEPGLPCFDERAFKNVILSEYGAHVDNERIPFVNLHPRAGHFRLQESIACGNALGLDKNADVPFVMVWHKGKLLGKFAMPHGSVKTVDLAYVHFFRREMDLAVDRLNSDGYYLIRPNVIEVYDGHDLTHDEICRLDRWRVHWRYFAKRLTFKTLKRKVAELWK